MRDKTALVTGSTGGLGLAIGTRLVEAGCRVMLHGLEPAAAMAEPLARLNAAGPGTAAYHAGDIADAAGVADLIAATTARFGAIDVLVNNAVVRHFATVEDYDPARWEEALAVNLSAPFHAIRAVLPAMRERGYGRIINLGSVYSLFASASRIDYVTTKTGLLGLTRVVALEVAGTDISCNLVCPGALPTPTMSARIETLAAQESITLAEATRRFLATKQPGGRFIDPAAVSGLILFLLTPEARDINGAALPVDAGWSAC
ncbi:MULTISPECIES: SDR family NAD(P)-dependent oxidoreductase [unclassified Xanthobacter]|uniref:SDR family NAD(P)-dependent oxidoreductase n=1 Tax=unclassified Xanthobacter TaxID=2623496 RepID=UPI001EDCA3B0|nr:MULTISPECIES: SDR family NAD(P)-dependent oxidoreductase [unclassified Xanthobacter]